MASIAGRAVGSRPSRPCRSRMASIAGRAVGCRAPSQPCRSRMASIAGQAVSGWAPVQPCRSKTASNAGQAGVCQAPSRPCRSRTGLKRRPGCEGRGSSGTWVGRGRAGVPPHKLQGAGSIGARRPCVQFAAGAPRHDPTPRSRTRPTAGKWIRPSPIQGLSTATTVNAFARHKDQSGTVCLHPSHRRDDADETEGRGRVGVPPQQTAHTAALKRLTPHPAVCEEVPRPGPARPTRRTHREPPQPGRRLRPVRDRHGRDGTRQPTARPALEAISDPRGQGRQREARPS